ncbi:hypothetical protein GGR56DRAFT_626296 [Xylariaceae sp. FL0804]|nr:hypothetical protein GGR56DRAFT_626296 [Xylariaceae sp. FL0804]
MLWPRFLLLQSSLQSPARAGDPAVVQRVQTRARQRGPAAANPTPSRLRRAPPSVGTAPLPMQSGVIRHTASPARTTKRLDPVGVDNWDAPRTHPDPATSMRCWTCTHNTPAVGGVAEDWYDSAYAPQESHPGPWYTYAPRPGTACPWRRAACVRPGSTRNHDRHMPRLRRLSPTWEPLLWVGSGPATCRLAATGSEGNRGNLCWGQAPTKVPGLPRFDGREFYPPSPTKAEAPASSQPFGSRLASSGRRPFDLSSHMRSSENGPFGSRLDAGSVRSLESGQKVNKAIPIVAPPSSLFFRFSSSFPPRPPGM